MADALDAIFKAYDVRGVYPDEIDESVAPQIGNAFVRFTGAVHGRSSAATCAPSSVPLAARSSRARPSPAPTSSTSASPRPTSSTSPRACSTRRRRCSPRATTRRSTTGIKLCRAGGGAGRRGRPGSPRSRRRSPPGCVERAEEAGPGRAPRPARRVRRARPLVRRRRRRSRPLRVVADTANGMGGLVVPAVFDGPAVRARRALRRARRHVPEPPGRPDPAREPRATCRRAVLDAGADVGLAFDGDADRVFLVDDRGQPVSGSTTTAIVAQGDPRAHRSRARRVVHNLICSKAVPEIIREHGRHAGAHPGRPLVHQAGDGRDRRDLRRRALGALLLPRQLARRLRAHRRARRARAALPGRRAAVGAAQAVRALRGSRARSTRRVDDPPRSIERGRRGVPRRRRRTGSTGSPSISATGGSTSGRATPSRCCASTSRRPTRLACEAHTAEVLALVRAEAD